MAELVQSMGILQWPEPRPHFESLCRAIIGQQLSTRAAQTIFARFAQWAEDSGGFKAEILLQTDESILRQLGISQQKTNYLIALSESWKDNPEVFEHMDSLSDEEVCAHLTSVKGIGPWTAQMFLMFTLMRRDVFAPGDLGIKKAMNQLYQLPMASSESVWVAQAAAWSPFRSWACLYLWRSLDN